jgi:hypothetical protein
MIKIEVRQGGYPVWISLTDDNGNAFSIRHTELLRLEHELAEAKRKVLCALPRTDWHEVDPKLTGGGQ